MAICGFNDAWANIFYGMIGQYLSLFIVLVNACMVMSLIWVDFQCKEDDSDQCLDAWAYGIKNLLGNAEHKHSNARFAFFLITSTFTGYLTLLLFRALSMLAVWKGVFSKDDLKQNSAIRIFKAVLFTVITLMQWIALALYLQAFIDNGYDWDTGPKVLVSVIVLSIWPMFRTWAKAYDAWNGDYWEKSGSGHWVSVGRRYTPVSTNHKGGKASFGVLGSSA